MISINISNIFSFSASSSTTVCRPILNNEITEEQEMSKANFPFNRQSNKKKSTSKLKLKWLEKTCKNNNDHYCFCPKYINCEKLINALSSISCHRNGHLLMFAIIISEWKSNVYFLFCLLSFLFNRMIFSGREKIIWAMTNGLNTGLRTFPKFESIE